MKFRDRIPEEFLVEGSNIDSLVTTLDALNFYKESKVVEHSLFYKSVLSFDKVWLKKRLDDYGYPPVPSSFPKEIMDTMTLNVKNVMALKGSDLGLRFFLWCLTLGEITIDWSLFYPQANILFLSEFVGKGYLLNKDPNDPSTDFVNYLVSNVSDVGSQVLTIGIKTPYYRNETIENYIRSHIQKFLNFTDEAFVLNLTLERGPYYRMPEAFWYFVNDHSETATPTGRGVGTFKVGSTFKVD